MLKKFILLVFCCSFISLIFLNSSINDILYKKNGEELMSGIRNIVVDDFDRIFCSLESSERIQVYDNEGKYLYGFNVNANGGLFKMDLNKDGYLQILTARASRMIYYSLDGVLVESHEGVRLSYKEFPDHKKYVKNGREYRIYSSSPYYVGVSVFDNTGNRGIVSNDMKHVKKYYLLKWLYTFCMISSLLSLFWLYDIYRSKSGLNIIKGQECSVEKLFYK